MSDDVEVCRTWLCRNPVAGVAPTNGLNLCRQHLDRDLQKAEEMKAALLGKLGRLLNAPDRKELATEARWLEAEIRDLDSAFDALQATVQQWRDNAVSRVKAAHDSVARRLTDAAGAEECEKEVTLACNAGDMRKAMTLSASIEMWVDDACEHLKLFRDARLELRNRQTREGQHLPVRAIGDVSSGVRQFQFTVDRHMADLMQRCWLDKEGDAPTAASVCRPMGSVENLPDKPYYVTSCGNTAGFVGNNATGRVEQGDHGTPLPQPCLFVAFDPDSESKNLLATSLDGTARLRVEWKFGKSAVTGLQCDSRRQLLFVAQLEAVTVMDLSGQQSGQLINASSLNRQLAEFNGIACNADQLFVLDRRAGSVLAIGKESREVQLTFDIGILSVENSKLRGPCLRRNKLLLVDHDRGQVHTVCAISGKLISTWPHQEPRLQKPWQVATDSRCLVIVSEYNGHSVRLVSDNGAILQTLGIPGEKGRHDNQFRYPTGIAVVESDSGDPNNRVSIAVADVTNKRLRLFEML